MIKRFTQISREDVLTCGGKGASLGEMTQAGFPVPNGFVLTTSAFGTDVHEWDDEVLHAFDQLNCTFVAVRSSGTKEDGSDDSFAGQFDTYLFVKKEKLIEQILECHQSVKSDRILAYCASKGINPDDIKVAVVVQKMVNSEVAGVAFTVNPITGNREEIMIEGGYGLGEAVVSGMITPDNYIIKKITEDFEGLQKISRDNGSPQLVRGTVPCPNNDTNRPNNDNHPNNTSRPNDTQITKQISEQSKKIVLDIEKGGTREEIVESTLVNVQKLSDEHIVQLAEYAERIEEHYGKPMDIEWAVENGEIFILQARPITTLGEEKEIFEKAYTRDTTFIIQQARHDGFVQGLSDMDTNKNPPYSVPVVHYMHGGTIEIWENETYLAYYLDKLLEQHNNGTAFYDRLVGEYLKVLTICEQRRKEKFTTDMVVLKQHIQMIFEAMKGFIVFYYAGMDERTPEKIREHGLHLRGADVFFAYNDKYIRESLVRIYPELKGYENCILWQEIDTPPLLEELKKRREQYVVQGTQYHSLITIDEYAVQHPEYYFPRKMPTITGNDLQGNTAYAGRVNGKVFVLLRNEQVHDVQIGDIIVAPMTTPEHVPAMEKAAAIITDEGGITCHAAIVARELKKPCIIGTKIATQVLKDGDLVEVDADTGVVRILETNEIKNTPIMTLERKEDNYEIKIKDKIYTPEVWKETPICCTYNGFPFFTSVFVKSAIFQETEWTTPHNYLLSFTSEGTIIQYVASNLIDKGHNAIKNILEHKQNYFHFFNQTHQQILDCIKECEIYLKNNKNNFQEIWSLIQDVLSNAQNIFNFSYALQGYLENVRKQNEELYIGLTSHIVATKQSFIDEAINYLKIQIKDNPNNFDVVYQNFMEHYGWFQNSYLGVNQTITKEWLKKFADDIANNNPTKEEKRNKESINEEYKLLVKIASEAISFQDDKKKLLTIAVIIMSNRLISISQKTNISFEDLYWLTVDELLTYDIEVSTEITRLAERVKQYKETGERFGIMTEKGYYDINKAFWSQVVALNSPKEEVNILTGSIGNRGKIQGTVKIVLNVEKDSKKLDEGEILVTSMTRPEFLPLMQKAAAFITDEGGITCHAAIIAREMKKPCIIGTKIATQVLKDGDLVEVDADTGVVRILEK